jgi:hypothetical protein
MSSFNSTVVTIYTIRFNIQRRNILLAECIYEYVFYMIARINSDCCREMAAGL